jgi:transcriptional regulator with XRE-family HTH domain
MCCGRAVPGVAATRFSLPCTRIPNDDRTSRQRRLRVKAGRWLRELRKDRGLTQRELKRMVGVGAEAFISQLENGKGRIPPERYVIWAHALGVEPGEFARKLLSYYDPLTYAILFRAKSGDASKSAAKPVSPKTPRNGETHLRLVV